MAQVYAADQGLGLQHETVDLIMYDDATSLLLIIKVCVRARTCMGLMSV